MSDAIAETFGPAARRPRNMLKLYDGVDLTVFHPSNSGGRIRQELAIAESERLVGIICRLDLWKGVDVFIRSAALVHRRLPEVRFLIAGGAIEGHEAYEGELRALARSLGVERALIFAGWRYRHRDVPEVLAALDVVVHASTQPEPYGLAVVEAMAAGAPLVATNIGGPAELATPDTAELIPPGDPERMARALCGLLEDPERRTQLAARARERAERLFDIDACVRRLEALYEETLAANTSAAWSLRKAG